MNKFFAFMKQFSDEMKQEIAYCWNQSTKFVQWYAHEYVY